MWCKLVQVVQVELPLVHKWKNKVVYSLNGTDHDPIFQISLLSTPAHIFAYLETLLCTNLHIPKQSCRKDIVSAYGPSVCSLN